MKRPTVIPTRILQSVMLFVAFFYYGISIVRPFRAPLTNSPQVWAVVCGAALVGIVLGFRLSLRKALFLSLIFLLFRAFAGIMLLTFGGLFCGAFGFSLFSLFYLTWIYKLGLFLALVLLTARMLDDDWKQNRQLRTTLIVVMCVALLFELINGIFLPLISQGYRPLFLNNFILQYCPILLPAWFHVLLYERARALDAPQPATQRAPGTEPVA